jgi:hypothetical protein
VMTGCHGDCDNSAVSRGRETSTIQQNSSRMIDSVVFLTTEQRLRLFLNYS